jgi:hypothetical protein
MIPARTGRILDQERVRDPILLERCQQLLARGRQP